MQTILEQAMDIAKNTPSFQLVIERPINYTIIVSALKVIAAEVESKNAHTN